MCTLPPIVFIASLKHGYLTLSLHSEILPCQCQYTLHRKDRGSRGGGVPIAVSDSVPGVLTSSTEELEIITVNVLITLCTVYVPPNSGDDYHKNLLSYLLVFHLLLTA